MRFCFDLDGTLCQGSEYETAIPIPERIATVNRLYDSGHYIIMNTARGYVSGNEWLTFTRNQIDAWGIKYNKLLVGRKPYADLYIDDKCINVDLFFEREQWEQFAG